jgi:hypothetical protein
MAFHRLACVFYVACFATSGVVRAFVDIGSTCESQLKDNYCENARNTTAANCEINGFYCDGIMKEVEYITQGGKIYCNQTTSVPCPAGMYCPNPSEQKDCPAGFYCRQGSSRPQFCTLGRLSCPKSNAAQITKANLLAVLVMFYVAFMIVFECITNYQIRMEEKQAEDIMVKAKEHEQLVAKAQLVNITAMIVTKPNASSASLNGRSMFGFGAAASEEHDAEMLNNLRSAYLTEAKVGSSMNIGLTTLASFGGSKANLNGYRQMSKQDFSTLFGTSQLLDVETASPSDFKRPPTLEMAPIREESTASLASVASPRASEPVAVGDDDEKGGKPAGAAGGYSAVPALPPPPAPTGPVKASSVHQVFVKTHAAGSGHGAAIDEALGAENDDFVHFIPREVANPIDVVFQGMNLKLKTNNAVILKNLCGELPHGRITALMGPSGEK